jgi:hypothetical protein
MEVYSASQITFDDRPTGKYHYTRSCSAGTSPVGYCADSCPGHDTPEEAREHYRQYLLDKCVVPIVMLEEQRKCLECGEWTQDAVLIDARERLVLCKEHQGREFLEKHLKN